MYDITAASSDHESIVGAGSKEKTLRSNSFLTRIRKRVQPR